VDRRGDEPAPIAPLNPCATAMPSTTGLAEYPIVLFPGEAAWREWLDLNHAAAPGLWLRLAKAASPLSSVSYAEALDVALCYGWIDGQKKSLDADSWLQKFTPRGKRSVWSKRNREHVERLIASGVMRPSGLAVVDAAKADGRWDRAYDSPASAEVPDDLAAALAAAPEALAFFETLTGANRYAVIYRVQTAVRPETRARRIVQIVEMLGRGETFHG
jgi:uncharacterized protein YdeI (YjbR/CyaY-like superfamily)